MSKLEAIEKIKKMLAKANSASNEFKHEVDVALTMAKKLMAKHDLSMADVDVNGDSDDYEFQANSAVSKKTTKWEKCLITAVEKLCSVTAIYSNIDTPGEVVLFVGTKCDVEIAKEMFSILSKIIHDSSLAYYSGLFGDVDPGPNNFFTNSYCHGFAHKILCRAVENIKIESPDDSERYDLIIADKDAKRVLWVKNKFNPGNASFKGDNVNAEHFNAGNVEGGSVSLQTKGVIGCDN